MHRLSAMICGRSLRFVYAVKTVRSDSFWGIGCDFSAVLIRLRLRCILRWKMAKFASRCGNSLRFRLRFKKSLAIAVAMPWCTSVASWKRNHLSFWQFVSRFTVIFAEFETNSCDGGTFGLVASSLVFWGISVVFGYLNPPFTTCPFRPPKFWMAFILTLKGKWPILIQKWQKWLKLGGKRQKDKRLHFTHVHGGVTQGGGARWTGKMWQIGVLTLKQRTFLPFWGVSSQSQL